MSYVVGIDVGGTFTDCVVIDAEGNVLTDKSFTVPGNPGQGMINALENVTATRNLSVRGVLSSAQAMAIGTTSITNKLVTRGGARVGYITTRGHEDAIFVGRIIAKSEGLSEADKSDVLKWSKPAPLVSRSMVRGINERIDFEGSVLVDLREEEIAVAVRELVDAGAEAIAVCLLWAFLNPVHELRIRDHIRARHPDVYVAISSSIAPVIGEYERGNATILSAHLGSLARNDMETTRALLSSHGLSRPFLVMQSNGGCMWGDEAGSAPLNLIASGPVGGIIGSTKLGERMGYRNIIATDMGGTTFDVGVVIDGAPILADISVQSRIRMAHPHVEVVSIGAGGGSIAWVDKATGRLHVGPQSAGSVPGPVAYGQGGEEPTVTDADVVLGRIDPARFFNGRKLLDRAKAEAAIKAKVADPIGCDVYTAAKGILDIVDSRMGDLIRKLTIERGVDPREFVLFSYGGAGPTHVAAYSRDLGIEMAIVSPQASVFSALGIASADIVRVYSLSSPLRSPFNVEQVNGLFARLDRQAQDELRARGVANAETAFSRTVEMRFRHQVHQIRVPVPNGALAAAHLDDAQRRFIALYEQSFGRGTAVVEAGVEILTFNVVASTRYGSLKLVEAPLTGGDPGRAMVGSRPVYFDGGFVETPVYEHSRLLPGDKIAGPAIVEGANTTLPLHPGQRADVDRFNNLIVYFSGSAS